MFEIYTFFYCISIDIFTVFRKGMLVLFETPARYAIFKVCEYIAKQFRSFSRQLCMFCGVQQLSQGAF